MSNSSENHTHVLSLGGSLLFLGDKLDIPFISAVRTMVREKVSAGDRFIIVVGGGSVARLYQRALADICAATDEDKDWMGVYTTRFNAQLLRLLLRDISAPDILLDPEQPLEDAPVLVAGGTKPGWSTDYVSTLYAKKVGARRIINITNVSHVYDKDPAKYPDAQSFSDLTWEAYEKVAPTKWVPGLHSPFDPRGAEEAKQHNIDIFIVGKDVENLKKVLSGETFMGTHIHA